MHTKESEGIHYEKVFALAVISIPFSLTCFSAQLLTLLSFSGPS